MRCVLACSRCRQQKIRCVHSGQPPCTYCSHKGCADECTLSFPPRKPSKNATKKKIDKRAMARGIPVQSENQLSQQIIEQQNVKLNSQQMMPARDEEKYRQDEMKFQQDQNMQVAPPMDAIFSAGMIPNIDDDMIRFHSLKNNVRAPIFSSIHNLVNSTPRKHILLAIKRIEVSFPEVLFFHLPTYEKKADEIDPILIGALLSTCSFFAPFQDRDEQSECFINDKWLGANSFQVKNNLYEKLSLDAIFNNSYFISKPDIEICQAILLLACVKWGHNDYFAAWMLLGCGSRLVQALQFDERFQQKCKLDPLLQELRVRTYWTAFCLDRIISTGENRCFIVNNFQDIELPLPEEQFFKLEQLDGKAQTYAPLDSDLYSVADINVYKPESSSKIQQEQKSSLNSIYNFDNDNKITIRNFTVFFQKYPNLIFNRENSAFLKSYSLWGAINEYMMEGGRERRPHEVPWDLENSVVGKISKDLKEFWDTLPNQWKWDQLDYGNQRRFQMKKVFILTTINCLHHLCVIFCIREYLPFLPSKSQGPCGPTDPPFLPDPPYPTYWLETSRKCFSSLRELCEILESIFEIETKNDGTINLIDSSPFFSFCAFVCAIQCNYGANFPYMDPDAALYEKQKKKNLSHCYKVMIKILKSRENTCAVTKNWLHMVLKVQEMYKFVSNNKNRVRTAPIVPSAPSRDPAEQENASLKSPLNGKQPPAKEQPHVEQQSAQNFIQSVAPQQQQLAPSLSLAETMDQLPIPPPLSNTNHSNLVGSSPNSFFGSNLGSIPNQQTPQSQMNTPTAINTQMQNNSGLDSQASSNPASTPRQPIDVEPDTDKLSLLFTDQEFEMLMQFSK